MELELAFIGLTFLTTVFFIIIGFKAIKKASSNSLKHRSILILSLAVWHLFIFLLSSSGVLKSYEFPPRFAIAFIVPSFFFIGAFLYRSRNKNWIEYIPESWVVSFQFFRVLVELLFVLALAKKIFNYQVTIEGYNFDMIFAFTAPIIAYLVYIKELLSRKIILVWNYIGLAILASVIFLFITSVYWPELFGSNIPLLPLAAFTYPYVLIAGFLMPAAVFLHFLSILQVTKN